MAFRAAGFFWPAAGITLEGGTLPALMSLLVSGLLMRLCGPRFAFVVTAALVAAPGLVHAADQAPDFGRDIRPIFAQHCAECHGAEKQLSGYRLDVRAKALAGGESGEAAIVAGKPDTSPLVARITSDDKDARMPPEGERLSAREVEMVRAWIAAGALGPTSLPAMKRPRKLIGRLLHRCGPSCP